MLEKCLNASYAYLVWLYYNVAFPYESCTRIQEKLFNTVDSRKASVFPFEPAPNATQDINHP